jgi:hypothetical protein
MATLLPAGIEVLWSAESRTRPDATDGQSWGLFCISESSIDRSVPKKFEWRQK